MNPFLEEDRLGNKSEHEAEDVPCKRVWFSWSPRTVIVIIIYVSLLLDNVLLTVIVPILPDFLLNTSRAAVADETVASNLLYKKYDFELVASIMSGGGVETTTATQRDMRLTSIYSAAVVADENVSIGVLLTTKAFVQLAFNPIIGAATKRIGYHWPIFLGTLSLLVSSFLFAIGDNYYSLLFARAVQGIGSSCLGVCGMSLVATLYPEVEKRSKVMGIVLGSIALGVLIGYPVGGILYDFVGKSSPFWIISLLLIAVVCVQVRCLSLNWMALKGDLWGGTGGSGEAYAEAVNGEVGRTVGTDTPPASCINWKDLLSDFEINLISMAIFISTSAMAILEPCLPLWLLTNLHPARWQLGTVFIPDSLGYLIGTNCFGKLAFERGQTRVAVVALGVIGCSCIIIPGSTSMASLLIPHFGLGLGIGVLDASLVPYLSSRIDAKYSSVGGGWCSDCSASDSVLSASYGTVYAIQQMAVSLAYSASPLLASEFVKFMGFPILMFCIGLLNIAYAVLFYYFTTGGPRARVNNYLFKDRDHLLLLHSARTKADDYDSGHYHRFYNTTN